MDEPIRQLLLFAPAFLISLSIHEFAHAWAADKLGDSTARHLGRLTLNPMAHASLFGTILFPAISILSGARIFFGWANPVPVNMNNFNNPRKGMAIVASAGPISNLILAFLCTGLLAAIYKSGMLHSDSLIAGPARETLQMAIQLNLFLAFFNLLPIQPLDGSRIVNAFVSQEMADFLDRHAMQAQIILLILIFTGLLRFLAIPVYLTMHYLYRLFDMPLMIF